MRKLDDLRGGRGDVDVALRIGDDAMRVRRRGGVCKRWRRRAGRVLLNGIATNARYVQIALRVVLQPIRIVEAGLDRNDRLIVGVEHLYSVMARRHGKQESS